jgi:hypothetical protein
MNTDYRPHLFPGGCWLDSFVRSIHRLLVRPTGPDCPHHRKATTS